ncbi:hypothetical protein SFRURICE_016861 [Spodoptera frugiperda]|nr:hypothetical protein SFRURICE_016861 [Spodoptera frugiperda]
MCRCSGIQPAWLCQIFVTIIPCGYTNYNTYTCNFGRLPRWLSGRKYDCRTRGLGSDSRVGQSITGLFLVFRKFVSSSTESGFVSMTFRAVMCTSAYTFGHTYPRRCRQRGVKNKIDINVTTFYFPYDLVVCVTKVMIQKLCVYEQTGLLMANIRCRPWSKSEVKNYLCQIDQEGTFERQIKYNNINNDSPLVALFARSKVIPIKKNEQETP